VLISDGNKNTPGHLSRSHGRNIPQSLNAVQPFIRIELSEDLMSAKLIIEPMSVNSSEITVKMLHEELRKNGITFGVNESKLTEAVSAWKKSKQRYEFDSVAIGVPPEPAKEGAIQFKIQSVTDSLKINRLREAEFFWQIGGLDSDLQRTSAGTVIAVKQKGTASVTGRNIRNQPAHTKELLKTLLFPGEGVYLSEDGNRVIANISGITVQENDTISVLPISFNGSVEISISPDEMIASLLVHPAFHGGSMPTAKDIHSQLLENGVVHGIDEKGLAELADGFAQGRIPEEPVIIARGTLPVDGKDGELKFYFNTETSLKPKLNPDGRVDYKDINIITSVSKDQKLASVCPPTKGVAGKTLTGGVLDASDGKPAKLAAGANTRIDPACPDCLLSNIEGVVRFNGNSIEVNEGFTVEGNVDFSTGHIKYEKDVLVKGDVKSGFDVQCGGDLQVCGTIEDSNLTIGGSALCRYGFIGQGKGCMTAEGNVNLGFIKNQTVRCWMSVNVAREVINSSIFARNTITIHGSPLSAAGGALTARDQIIVNTVGNRSGTKTILEVGVDFTKTDDLFKAENEINELKANLARLIKAQKEYQQLQTGTKKPPGNTTAMVSKISTAIDRYKENLEELEMRKKAIEAIAFNFSRSNIKINRGAFSGTLFKFGGRHLLLREEITGPKTVCLRGQEIRIF